MEKPIVGSSDFKEVHEPIILSNPSTEGLDHPISMQSFPSYSPSLGYLDRLLKTHFGVGSVILGVSFTGFGTVMLAISSNGQEGSIVGYLFLCLGLLVIAFGSIVLVVINRRERRRFLDASRMSRQEASSQVTFGGTVEQPSVLYRPNAEPPEIGDGKS